MARFRRSQAASGTRCHLHVLALTLSLVTVGCASTAVDSSALPPRPGASAASGEFVLALAGTPGPMADEMRAFGSSLGSAIEADLAPDEDLRTACETNRSVVLRPRLRRIHFNSNAPERNTLFIYETAIIVGIPVALIGAVAWPFYAETIAEGELEVLRCDQQAPLRHIDSFHVRSEGRGFVRTEPLRDAQVDGAIRGVTRQLLIENLSFIQTGRST